MGFNVPYLNITDKQYRFNPGLPGDLIYRFLSLLHTYGETHSIVRTFISGDLP